jgi:N-acetylneuraminic acid mutarotase
MPTARYAMGCVPVSDSIFTLDGCPSGHTTLEVFKPSTNSWSIKTSDLLGRGWTTAAYCIGKIYVIGGAPTIYATKYVSAYEIASNSWTSVDSIPFKSSNNCAITVNNAVYVMGGNTDNAIMTDSICKYDPATTKWNIMKSKMPVALGSYAAATINGKIFIFGGYGNGGQIKNSVMVYDPSLDN